MKGKGHLSIGDRLLASFCKRAKGKRHLVIGDRFRVQGFLIPYSFPVKGIHLLDLGERLYLLSLNGSLSIFSLRFGSGLMAHSEYG